jgi:hypothetical protein
VLEFLATSMYVVQNFPHNISLIHKLKKAPMGRRFKDVTIQEHLQTALYCFKVTEKATPSIIANMIESTWHMCEFFHQTSIYM